MLSLFGPTALRYPNGRVPVGEDVEVRTEGGVLVSVYSDSFGTPTSNPIILGDLGNLSFFANPGFYVLHVNGSEIPIEIDGPSGGGAGSYIHHQTTPSASWTVQHNLGVPKMPLVLLDSSPGELSFTEYSIVDANSMSLVFDNAVTGFAYL